MVLKVDFLAVGGCKRNDAIEFFRAITLHRVVRHERATRTRKMSPIGFLCRNAVGLACKIRLATDRKEMN
jgi:hypothetical protein